MISAWCGNRFFRTLSLFYQSKSLFYSPNIQFKTTVGSGTASSVFVRYLVDGFDKIVHRKKLRISSTCPRPNYPHFRRKWKYCSTDWMFRPKILVLEAGPKLNWFQRMLSDIPLTAALLFGLGTDKVYPTTRQKSAAFQLKNQVSNSV